MAHLGNPIGRWFGITLAAVLVAIFSLTGPAMAEAPEKLKIAVILTTGPDEPWDGSFIRDYKAIRAEKPHGLKINEIVFTEGVWGDSAEAAARLYARKGYDIVWLHSTYSDQVKKIMKKYPEVLFVVVGSGNTGHGTNQYWAYMRDYEVAYLQGVIAGMTTKSKILGVVGSFPADDVWDKINAFYAGAESVTPDIKKKVTFIESWYDPPKAKEASNAQIAAGADHILMLANAFEAFKGTAVMAHGAYRNWIEVAPDSVVSSSVISWKPQLNWIIDEWYQAKSAGKPYSGNTEPKWFTMAENGADLVISDKLPAEVKSKVEEIKTKIMEGSLKVDLVVSPVTSD